MQISMILTDNPLEQSQQGFRFQANKDSETSDFKVMKMLTKTTDTAKDTILSDPISSLSRLEKGFNYEQENWRMLDAHSIIYESNPKTFLEWGRTTCSNYDIRVKTVKKGWIRIECKFTLTHIYHSWFMRDWHPRDCDIFVTNDEWNVRYEDRKLLRETGRKLMNTREFLNYILKQCKRGNKYRVFEYLRTSSVASELLCSTVLVTVCCVLALHFHVLKASVLRFLGYLILIPWTLMDHLSKWSQCKNREGTTECEYQSNVNNQIQAMFLEPKGKREITSSMDALFLMEPDGC